MGTWFHGHVESGLFGQELLDFLVQLLIGEFGPIGAGPDTAALAIEQGQMRDQEAIADQLDQSFFFLIRLNQDEVGEGSSFLLKDNLGNFLTHGTHQVAQQSMRMTFPLWSWMAFSNCATRTSATWIFPASSGGKPRLQPTQATTLAIPTSSKCVIVGCIVNLSSFQKSVTG
jgi:hypothetical protein